MDNKKSNLDRKKAALHRQNKSFSKTLYIIAGLFLILLIIFFIGSFLEPKTTLNVYPTATRGHPLGENTPLPSDSKSTPQLVGTKQYSSAPPMLIDTTRKYYANVKMVKGGEFVIQLFPDKAPITVNSFVFLARQGYFDGVTFHRVLENFMAQTGDPTGTGGGGPGYEFVNEDSDLVFDKPGLVAMANSGRDTNGSQFFITFVPTDWLNGGYTIFGEVITGMDVVKSITLRNPEKKPAFTGDEIESITISEE